MSKNKIKYQLEFKSFDQKLLTYNLISILFELKKNFNFLKFNKISSIPYTTKKTCVIRSPFVDKVSKEHFEIRVFKILINIEILNLNNFFLDKIFEEYLVNVLKNQEITVSYKKIVLNNY